MDVDLMAGAASVATANESLQLRDTWSLVPKALKGKRGGCTHHGIKGDA